MGAVFASKETFSRFKLCESLLTWSTESRKLRYQFFGLMSDVQFWVFRFFRLMSDVQRGIVFVGGFGEPALRSSCLRDCPTPRRGICGGGESVWLALVCA